MEKKEGEIQMTMKERIDSLRNAVAFGEENHKRNLIVDLDLLAELFRGNVPVGGNEFPPETVNAMLYDEKARRIYYQDIVYAVCVQLDTIFAKRPGNGIVCGTKNEPSRQVQEHMAIVVERCDRLAKMQAEQEPPAQPLTKRCPDCGYSQDDALFHGDHHLCTGKIPT